MGKPDICMPCEKDNCGHCLYEVVAIATTMVVICQCDDADHEKCTSCGTLLTEDARHPCNCGCQYCNDCANECRACEDEAIREETLTRRVG